MKQVKINKGEDMYKSMKLYCPYCKTTREINLKEVIGRYVICPGCNQKFRWEMTDKNNLQIIFFH